MRSSVVRMSFKQSTFKSCLFLYYSSRDPYQYVHCKVVKAVMMFSLLGSMAYLFIYFFKYKFGVVRIINNLFGFKKNKNCERVMQELWFDEGIIHFCFVLTLRFCRILLLIPKHAIPRAACLYTILL